MKVLKWGLERSLICILSVHMNCYCAQICFLAIYKEPSHRYLYILVRMLGFASVAVVDFAMFLHITFIRPNLTLAGCPTMISLCVWSLYNEELVVLKGIICVMLKL